MAKELKGSTSNLTVGLNVLMVPLMLFIWALNTNKTRLTAMEVTAGAGERFQKYIG